MARLPSPPPNRQAAAGAPVPSLPETGMAGADGASMASGSGRSPSLPPFSPPSSGSALGDRPAAPAAPWMATPPPHSPPLPASPLPTAATAGSAAIHTYHPPIPDTSHPSPPTAPPPLRVSASDRQLAGFLRQRSHQPAHGSTPPPHPNPRNTSRTHPQPSRPPGGLHPIGQAPARPGAQPSNRRAPRPAAPSVPRPSRPRSPQHPPQPPPTARRPLRRSPVPKQPHRAPAPQQRSRRLWAILLLAWAFLWLMGGVAAVHLLRATTRPSEAMWNTPTVQGGGVQGVNGTTTGDRPDPNRIPLNEMPASEAVPGLNPNPPGLPNGPTTGPNPTNTDANTDANTPRSPGPSFGLLLMIFVTCGAIGWVRLQQMQRSAGQRQRRQRLQGRSTQRLGRPTVSKNSV